jgi:hypothetical protein
MAGNGPAPAEQKRRRNKENLEELPAEGYQGAFPPLPEKYRIERIVMVKDPETKKRVPETIVLEPEYLPATRDWYETWARSPMAVEFTAVHWQRLLRLARVVDQFERTSDEKLLAEIRLQEAGFGGTPMDLRRLGRKITPVAGAAQPARRRDRKATDRRARLSVVQ